MRLKVFCINFSQRSKWTSKHQKLNMIFQEERFRIYLQYLLQVVSSGKMRLRVDSMMFARWAWMTRSNFVAAGIKGKDLFSCSSTWHDIDNDKHCGIVDRKFSILNASGLLEHLERIEWIYIIQPAACPSNKKARMCRRDLDSLPENP